MNGKIVTVSVACNAPWNVGDVANVSGVRLGASN